MPRAKEFEEEDILQRTMELFWDKGYHSTTIQELVDHLGVNRASLYQTFGDKESLYCRALHFYWEKVIKFMEDTLEGEKNVRKGFEKVLGAQVTQFAEDRLIRGCFITNATTELLPQIDAAHGPLNNYQREKVALFKHYLQKGKDQGEFSAMLDTENTAQFLCTVLSGISLLSKIESDSDCLKRILHNALQILN